MRRGQKSFHGFKFGTIIGRFPNDGVSSMAQKRLIIDWAVSQHTDTSENAKATLNCYYARIVPCITAVALNNYLGHWITQHWHIDKQKQHQGYIKILICVRSSLHNSIHPPEMAINPLKITCGCPCGRVRNEKKRKKENKNKQTNKTRKNKQTTKTTMHTRIFPPNLWHAFSSAHMHFPGDSQSVKLLGNATTHCSNTYTGDDDDDDDDDDDAGGQIGK